MIRQWMAACSAAGLVFCPIAGATEGGGSLYPNGAENFAAGALPPPGFYGLVYVQHYHASRLDGPGGQRVDVPGFGVRVDAVAPMLVWVTPETLFGANVAFHAVFPLVDLRLSMQGTEQRKTGLGDITLGPGLAFHHSPSLHSLVALDVHLPTGSYDPDDLANIGRHYAAVEPVYAVSRVAAEGFNGDIKAGYLLNGRNSATGYASGNELHSDFALGWAFGNGWTSGLGGYVYQQTGTDRLAGREVADSKGRAMAAGPSVKFESGKGWFVTLKWEREFAVENRTQGSSAWIKAVFPL